MSGKMHKRIFLDTCALLWLGLGSKELPDAARKAIRHADIVFVSPISAWEITMKVDRGLLEFPCDPLEWFKQILEVHDLSLSPLSVEVLSQSATLPYHHRDPADRFIIASAMQENCPVVTADRKFSDYEVEVIF